MLNIRLILAVIMMLCLHINVNAKISVHSEPAAVQVGEAFRLIFTLEDPKPVGVPNLTPLQENFTIVGTERNSAYTIINGQTHSVNQWIVILTAKKAGDLTIPAIQFGPQQSTATTISVSEEQTTPTQDTQPGLSQDEVMLKTSVDQETPFINQQLIYTVKLYNNQRLLDAEYIPPRVEDAVVVPMGDARRTQTIIEGQSYSVEEQQYAIFPQKSGPLKIIAPSFKALVFDTVPRRINVHAKTMTLEVKPIPSSHTGRYWLPAKQLALTEIYDPSETSLKQGSTLTRTITIQAAGVPAQLLPTLAFANNKQFNAYAEKPQLHNSARQQDLIGRADIKVTYVLNKAGSITIPELQVPWFNTETGKQEMTTLPPHTIEVEATASATPSSTTIEAPISRTEGKKSLPMTETNYPIDLAWWLAGGFALAWVVTLLLLWRYKRVNVTKAGKKEALDSLHKACIKNNPKRAHAALLRWANYQWPEASILNLQQIGKLVHDATLKKQLILLSKVLYSSDRNIQWQGDALWRSIRAYLNTKSATKKKSSELPSINPSGQTHTLFE